MTKELIEAIAYEDIMSDVQVSARIAARGRIWHAMNDLGYIPTPEAVKVIRAAAFGGLRDALAALREQPSEASLFDRQECGPCEGKGYRGNLCCTRCQGDGAIYLRIHDKQPREASPASDAVEAIKALGYQRTFNAIAAAVSVNGVGVGISVAKFNAALEGKTDEALPLMTAAFRTTTSGPDGCTMNFKFKDIEQLLAADDEWRAFQEDKADGR